MDGEAVLSTVSGGKRPTNDEVAPFGCNQASSRLSIPSVAVSHPQRNGRRLNSLALMVQGKDL
jgi:hypothetical protein